MPIQSESDIQTLKIINSSFSNFLYKMGSFIRLPQRKDQTINKLDTLPFKVQVQNSTFSGFQTCGSLISNDNPVFGNQSEYMSLISNSYQDIVEENYSKDADHSVANLGVDKLYSIEFENNTISFMNSLGQSSNKLFDRKVPKLMEKVGIVLHLVRFQGKLLVENNQFMNSKIIVSDMCNYQKFQEGETMLFYSSQVTHWDDQSTFDQITSANPEVGFATL